MKKIFIIMTFALSGLMAHAQNVIFVSGHIKSNGTFVQGHYRTVSNHTVMDNFSTCTNINPYTGQMGQKHPEVITFQPVSNQGSSVNYPTNNLFRTNELFRTNDVFKTNNLFR